MNKACDGHVLAKYISWAGSINMEHFHIGRFPCLNIPSSLLPIYSLENSSGVIVDHFNGGKYKSQTRCLFYIETDR